MLLPCLVTLGSASVCLCLTCWSVTRGLSPFKGCCCLLAAPCNCFVNIQEPHGPFSCVVSLP